MHTVCAITDEAGRHLYIGVTQDLRHRMTRHRSGSTWLPERFPRWAVEQRIGGAS